MEIKFIWVEEYRNIIQDLNINLYHTGAHRFHYESGRLTLSLNDLSLLDFGPKVSGITAIAGQNGSGKSSICEVILNAAATLVNGGFSFEFPFKGILCYGNYIFYSKQIPLDNAQELQGAGYTIIAYTDTPLDNVPHDLKPEFIKRGFIYYSNQLDWRSSMSLMNLSNISTEEFIQSDFRTGTAILPDFGDNKENPNFIGTYFENQSYRNTKFYLNFPGHIPFPKPVSFLLKNTFSGNNRALTLRTAEADEHSFFREQEQNILSEIYPPFQQPIIDERIAVNQALFKKISGRLYRLNLVIASGKTLEKFPAAELVVQFVYESSAVEDIFPSSQKVIQLLKLHDELMTAGYFHHEFYPYYLVDKFKEKWRFYPVEFFYIPNDDTTIPALRDLMRLEEEIINDQTHFLKRISNYGLQPFNSSGEYSYYSLFSRLFDVIQRYDHGADDRKTIVLVLDEAEVGYHPAWKKKFLKWVLDFLNEDFNNYHFQIILTTHSPYLLSDLSSEHILLLKKENNRTNIIPPDDFQTFGANINELLADSFFMHEGLIGDFAQQTIQHVIDQLNDWRDAKLAGKLDTRQHEKRHWCLGIISMIADGIVRNKLFEMYWDIFEDQGAIDNEIGLLEARIEQLKARKKS